MKKAWIPVDPIVEGDFRKAGVVETLAADGTVRLGVYDHLLMHWTWCDERGDIEYPPSFPDWVPTHWREANLPDYWPYKSQEHFEQVKAANGR